MSRPLTWPHWIALMMVMVPLTIVARDDNTPALSEFKMVGAGTLTWLGMRVYDAILLTPSGDYRPDQPHALKIDYGFRFSREQLARRSLEEIERIHGKWPDGDAVLQTLKGVFPDVAKGDQITGIHSPGTGAAFSGSKGPLGRIEDSELAAAFFSIWLSPSTSKPDLRAQLLGLRP